MDIMSRTSLDSMEALRKASLESMAKIIQTYSKGDTVEQCLYKVIQERGNSSSYKELDDRLVLSMFTLFPDEFCEWGMFEAYQDNHTNISNSYFF